MNMVFYMHDHISPSEIVTAIPVAGSNGSSSDPGTFGTLLVFCDNTTSGPDDSDNIVGRAQGTYTNTNLYTQLDFFMVFSLIFQNLKYSGSTLEIQGTLRLDQPQSEYAVVGGTGKFRLARGYVIVTPENISGSNSVLKLNTTLIIPH